MKVKTKLAKKLTENEVVYYLCKYLEDEGWEICSKKLDYQKGIDIEAKKEEKYLVVEAKGAVANSSAKAKKRDCFKSNQIKTHFGAALLKALDLKLKQPNWLVAIAQPDDDLVKKYTAKYFPFLKKLGVSHFSIANDGSVIKE